MLLLIKRCDPHGIISVHPLLRLSKQKLMVLPQFLLTVSDINIARGLVLTMSVLAMIITKYPFF